MPSRNLIKEFSEQQYYHVYNRGVEKRVIFLDDQDYTVFIGLIKKYLTGENHNPKNRHKYSVLNEKVKVLAYCLMPNHFHLLLYQVAEDGITQFMRRLSTGYAMYFNNRYQRVGPLFQGTYKASLINHDAYLHHVSRYIHLNPPDYEKWSYSSLEYYRGNKSAGWLSDDLLLDMFDGSRADYLEFVKDYETSQKELSILKWQLANDPDDE